MQTLEDLRRRVDNARDMQSVVAAMKVLAVVSIRQFERSLESLSLYNRTIELGLQVALKNRPREIRIEDAGPAPEGVCALVFGSEQGLSGQFNEQIVQYTLDHLEEAGYSGMPLKLLAMGEHVVYRLGAAGVEPDGSFAIPGSVAAMKRAVHDIFVAVDTLQQDGKADVVLLFYHKPLSGAAYEPRCRRLFPLDASFLLDLASRPWQSRSLPVFHLDWNELFSSLVRQHIAATLETAFAESLLSENTSRLFAMQVAEKNIADYLDELDHAFNNQRQGQITAELLDIVAGSEAIYEEEEDYLEPY